MSNSLAKKFFASVLAAATVLAASPLVASAHGIDSLVKSSDGTIWFVTTEGSQTVRRPFTSFGAFQSYGFMSLSKVVDADAQDLAYPTGSFIAPQDGKIFCATETKGSDVKGECSLVTGGQKAAFTSAAVFTGQGFSFSRALYGDSSFLVKTTNIDNTTASHNAGVLVNNSGTVQLVVNGGLWGIPSLDVFNSYGFSFADVVPANGADKNLNQIGVMTARQPGQLSPGVTTSPTPGGAFSAALASDNPASSTLVAGQAIADLAHFALSGSGTVTALKFKRTGVSADATLQNVYLFDGATRITDAATVSSGFVTFSGLNLSVSGSKTIAIKSDILSTATGETVGAQLVEVNAVALGTQPSGSIHTIATATLASVAVGTPTPSSAATTDPGVDVRVWESQVTVGTRDVVLSRMAFRQINSIQTADIKNFRLLIDGTQVGSAVASLDSNNYVTFSGFTKTLATGARTVKVIADVTGGSSRIVQMSLRNKADIEAKDTQYNVNVAATGTFPASTSTITVNSGTMTVQKTSDSPSGNVTKDASDQVLARYTFTAYGEPIKVETLNVAVDTSGTDADYTLRNGKIYVNGAQVGSTTGLVAAGAASSAASFTTNFVVNPGSPATVEVRADIYDEESGGAEFVADDTIQVTLLQGSANATRQVSLGTTAVPSADSLAGQLVVKTGTMTLASSTNYTGHNITIPKTAYKLGAWTLTGGSTEDINVHTFSLDIDNVTGSTFTFADLSDLYLKFGPQGGTLTQGQVKASPTAADNDWSVSFVLPKNAVYDVELYGNVLSGGITATHSFKSDLTATGTGAASGTSISQADKDGQTLAYQTASITESALDSAPSTFITEDNATKQVASFKFQATGDTYTVYELVFDMSGATTVQNLIVKDNGVVIGTRPAATSDVTFSDLNITVPNNGDKIITVEAQLGTVGTGAGTSREDIKVTLDSYRNRDSQGSSAQDTTDNAGQSVLVFRAIPTITKGTIASTTLVNSEMEVYKVTVTPVGGNVAVKQFGLKVTLTDNNADNTLTLGDWRVFRTVGGSTSEITSTVRIVDEDGTSVKTGGTAFPEADTHVYVTFGSGAQGEDELSSAATYTFKATPAGFNDTTDDDSIRVELLDDATSADRYINDADATTAELIATLAASDGTGKDSLPVYFLWSDLSASPHDADLVDDADGTADTSTSTADWTNGYLVQSSPLAADVIVY